MFNFMPLMNHLIYPADSADFLRLRRKIDMVSDVAVFLHSTWYMLCLLCYKRGTFEGTLKGSCGGNRGSMVVV